MEYILFLCATIPGLISVYLFAKHGIPCIFKRHKFRAYAVSYLDYDRDDVHIHKRKGLIFRCKECGKIVKAKDHPDTNSRHD